MGGFGRSKTFWERAGTRSGQVWDAKKRNPGPCAKLKLAADQDGQPPAVARDGEDDQVTGRGPGSETFHSK